MISELLLNEFAKRDRFSFSNPKDVLMLIGKILGLALFIFLEYFLFASLDSKLRDYSPYGSFDFLVIACSLIVFTSVLINGVNSRSLFFSKDDDIILHSLPIDDFSLIFSKLLYLYIKLCIQISSLCFPLIVIYGSLNGLQAPYYVLAIFFGIMMSFAFLFWSALIAYVFDFVHKFLANRYFVQIILGGLLCIGVAYLYQNLLSLFLSLLTNVEIGGIFSLTFLDEIHLISAYLIPVYSFLSLGSAQGVFLINLMWVFVFILFSLSFSIGVLPHLFSFHMKSEKERSYKNKKEPVLRVYSPFRNLVKKETMLLFRDSSALFSYSALLLMEPFLSYFVLSSLKGILYYNMPALNTYFPYLFDALEILIMLLFLGLISSSSVSSFSKEKPYLPILKSNPGDKRKIILSKLLVPFIFSSLSYVISLGVAYGFSLTNLQNSFLALLLGLLLIVLEEFAGLKSNIVALSDPRDEDDGSGSASFFGVFLPFVYAFAYILMSVFALPYYAIFLILLSAGVILIIPFVYKGDKPYLLELDKIEANN
jgi:hypothetical protein